MAVDKKISQLTSLAQVDVAASTDVLPIVDTSATETKKITVSALVGAGATAGLTNVDINSGTIDGTTIGASSASTGAFTTLSASGVATFAAGTAALPSLTTTGDTNTGGFFPAADTVGVTTGGSERLRVDSSGNVQVGTTTAAAGGLLTLNRAPAAAFGTPMLQVGGASFTAGGYYSIGLGFTDATYTEPPGEIVFITNSSSGGTNGSIAFGTRSVTTNTAVTERMRIDNSGNVGIGTASPGAKISVSGGSSTFAHINGGNSNTDPIFASVDNATISSANYGWLWFNNATNGNLDLYRRAGSTTNTHVASFVRASGNMLLGTSTGLGEGARLDIVTASGEADVTTWRYTDAAAGKYWRWVIDSNSRIYLTNQGSVGVYINDGDTAWTAYSDERAKADLKPIENSVNKICQLRAVTGRFKKDDEGVSRSFLIAQDVQKVFPEAVSDINPDELGVRYTDVIPLLVASVKELKAENDALKARIEALEAK